MSVIIYLHGFLSSPSSLKARQVGEWLAEFRPELQYCCPALSAYPECAQKTVQALINELGVDNISGFIGSSLGGFYATYFGQKYARPSVVINPSVKPYDRLVEFLGPQKSYHDETVYHMETKHMDELKILETESLLIPENFWTLLQTGDEVLDYRQAEEKYQAGKLTIEQGGDHSFKDFEKHIPEVIQFLTATSSIKNK